MASCNQCGAAYGPADRFCQQCGSAVPQVAPTAVSAAGGNPRVEQSPGFPAQPAAVPVGDYADWGTRFGGFLLDALVSFIALLPLYILGSFVTAFIYLDWLVAIGVAVFFGFQIGGTGQSPGMRVMGLKCVHERTGEPIGPGLGVLRMLASALNSITCYIGWLFPLWDARRQTLGDKAMSTVVVRVPKQRFSLTPPGA